VKSANFDDILELSRGTVKDINKSLQKYLKFTQKPFTKFPAWKDLVGGNKVGEYICIFSSNAQKCMFFCAECRTKRIQGEEFVRQLRKWSKHFGAENGKSLFPLIEKTEFRLDKMREVSYILKDKHGQIQEDINSLKVMSRLISE
jgi:hypothetical protein